MRGTVSHAPSGPGRDFSKNEGDPYEPEAQRLFEDGVRGGRRDGRPDGTTVYSSGWIAAVGNRFQKNHQEDNEEAFFNDMVNNPCLKTEA